MGGRTLGERNKEEYEEARGRGRRLKMNKTRYCTYPGLELRQF